jgi:hypothetical protein
MKKVSTGVNQDPLDSDRPSHGRDYTHDPVVSEIAIFRQVLAELPSDH